MALSNTMKITDNIHVYYADRVNQIYHALRGNWTISGGAITGTAVSLTGAGTHANVSAGTIWCVGAVATLSSLTIDLSTEWATISNGDEMQVYVYATSAGVITTLSGSTALVGESVPPDFGSLPADCVLLGTIMLTGVTDTTVDSSDIFDDRLYADRSYVDQYEGIGSGNVIREPLEPTTVANGSLNSGGLPISATEDTSGVGMGIAITIPLPCNKGDLSLRIAQIGLYLNDADGNNYVDSLFMIGKKGEVSSPTILNVSGLAWDSTGAKVHNPSDIDCDTYFSVQLLISCENDTTGSALEIMDIWIDYYYA